MNIKNRYIFNQMAVAKGWLIKTFLLLLLLFVACGEPDDMFGTIYGDDEEIELTINTLLPDGGISTRTAPAENITSITALAFDRNYELIKVQTSEVVQSTTSNTTGTFKVTVPQRTRRIHFIAKNNGEFTEITESDYGKTDVGLLVNRISSIQNSQDADGISNALHYWQMLDFDSAEDLKDLSDELQALDKKPGDGYQLPLIRNMAKITLNLKDGMTGHIAGILNYNTTGTIVPYLNKDGNNYTFCYQDTTNHELPSTFVITSDVSNYSNLGTVHYLFEEYNDVGDLIYVMCYIDNDGESGNEDSGHFYKVALVKPKFTGVEDKYYYVIRNQAYNINIVGKLDVTLGKTDYSDAVQNGKPINDSEKEQVHLDFEPDEVYMYIGEPGTVTVKIPEGIAELQIGFPSERFDADGVIAKNTAGNNLENSTTTNGNIHISTYAVTGLSEIVLSMNLKSSIQDAISGMELQFIGSGEDKIVNDKLVVHVLKRDALNVTPTAVEIPRTKGNSFSVNVIIPRFDNYDGAYELTVNDKNNKYNITAPGTLALHDGVYNVEKGQTYTFEFELREDGTEGEEHTIDFHLATDYHDYDATTIVTLIDNVVHDQDYEIWVDNSTWTGTENSVEFFGYNKTTPEGSFAAGTTPNGFRTEFYDTGANSHISQSMVMGSDDSFTFTIPEGKNRWLTMLVAANSGTPSIKLMQELMQGETEWTTSAAADATTVPANYNFGNGEIGTAGRLIRYELAPGTYTLQRGSADYLLYYMRVTKDKPVMTDVAQPQLTDYTLSWSGGEYDDINGKGYLKISDKKHIVDEDNLTHTVSLKADNSLSLKTSLNLTSDLSTFDLYITQPTYTFVEPNDDNNNNGSITIGNDNLDEYKNIVPSSELRLENNGGDYVLSGKIIEPAYKYSAFYDVLQLNQVEYEVKNPIVPALYNSMDGDKLTPVENWTTMDDAWAIGFFMPSPMPIEYASASDRPEIAISIPGWTKSDSGTSSGLGIVVDSENKIYTLTTQDNSVHPRPGWTYKIQWADRASSTISPEIVDKSSDVYFTYMGNIAKKVDVAVPEIKETSLNITLDFYADVDGDGEIENQGNSFNNLLLKLTDQTVASKVWLEATVTGDLSDYYGDNVVLTGEFPAYNAQYSGWAIHWVNSKKSGAINYYGKDQNGTGLQFTIDQNNTEQVYLIEWEFVPSTNNYQGYGDIGFTYKISAYADSPVKYNLTGDTQATIEFTNEPTNAEPDNTGGTTIWTGSRQWGDWSAGDYQPNYLAINYFLPAGTEIILNVTSANGGAVEMHDCTLTSLRLTSSDVTYPMQDDNYFNVGSGNTSPKFTVPSGGVNGLRINGSNVTITSVVVKYPNKTGQIFSRDFSDGQTINGWGENGKDNVSRSIGNENGNNYLILSNTGGFAQAAIDGEYEPGNYTLTFKVRGTVSGKMNMIFQHNYDPSDTNPVYDETVGNSNPNPVEFTTEWPGQPVEVNITLNKGANRFLINYTDFTGDIHIDDLKLVRNN